MTDKPLPEPPAYGTALEAEARRRVLHERRTATSLAGHPLLDVPGFDGAHIGGLSCDGECCDPPAAEVLDAEHRDDSFVIGQQRAQRQVAAWRPSVQLPAPLPDDPTAILDEPDVPAWQQAAAGRLDEIADVMQQIVEHAQDPSFGVTSFGGVTADDEFCADCGTVHPPLLATYDRVYVNSYAGVPDDWEEVSIVSVGMDPAGSVDVIGVQFDDGPIVVMSPTALERLGITVSVL